MQSQLCLPRTKLERGSSQDASQTRLFARCVCVCVCNLFRSGSVFQWGQHPVRKKYVYSNPNPPLACWWVSESYSPDPAVACLWSLSISYPVPRMRRCCCIALCCRLQDVRTTAVHIDPLRPGCVRVTLRVLVCVAGRRRGFAQLPVKCKQTWCSETDSFLLSENSTTPLLWSLLHLPPPLLAGHAQLLPPHTS